MNEVVPKRKRGRPPKIRKDNNALLPIEFPASHLAEANARQIQFSYKILQNILKLSKIKHLLDKPDENLFGLENYYSIVSKPIWLNEVLRKFSAQEYLCVNEVIGDMRQILENCYRFWGPRHKFSKHAFRIEKLIEKELNGVPQHIRDMCSLEVSEDENSTASENDSSSFFVDEFNSKILKILEKKEKEEDILKEGSEVLTKDELLKWESDVLLMKQYKKQIIFMPELAEIGHFLQLTHEVLCLRTILQYEVERMLLMPKESSTLATIMTALLCPTAMRGNLYFKPTMVYEVWTQLLSKKVDSWYVNLSKIDNKIQVFVRHGIEPEFWEAVGASNPLLTHDFIALPFLKRVWILKTLCTTIFHSNKKIEEYFNSVDENCLRGTIVFEDGRYEYVSVFSPEIRVYRICKSQIDTDGKSETVQNGLQKHPYNLIHDLQSQTQKSLGKKNKFYIAAYDRESLEGLIKTFYSKKKSLSAVKKLLSEEQNEIKMLKALKSMYIQWQKNKERCLNVINNSIKYWIEKDFSPPLSPGQKNGENVSSNDLFNLGKRQLKRKFSLEELENSSDSSVEQVAEDDTSDWEEGNIRRSRRKRPKWSRWTRDPFMEEGLFSRMPRSTLGLSSFSSPLPIPSLGNVLPPLPDLAPAPPVYSQTRYCPPKTKNHFSFTPTPRFARRYGFSVRRPVIPRPCITAAAVENTQCMENFTNEASKALEIRVPQKTSCNSMNSLKSMEMMAQLSNHKPIQDPLLLPEPLSLSSNTPETNQAQVRVLYLNNTASPVSNHLDENRLGPQKPPCPLNTCPIVLAVPALLPSLYIVL